MRRSFDEFLSHKDEIEILKVLSDVEFRKEFIELFMNALIKSEFEMFLGYKKYERTDLEKTNYRNGNHKKKFKTKDGEIELTIPHDRNRDFYPSSVPKHKRRSEEISSAIIELFALGNSNREVVTFVDKVFGASYSPQTVSNVVEVLDEVVKEFNSRKISKDYFAIFMDATYIPIRFNNSYEKQAVYLVCGITNEGYQEILGYTIGFSENLSLWEELLQNLKDRGLESCKIFVMDGARGVPELTKSLFHDSLIQLCVFHSMKNLSNKLRVADRKEIMGFVAEVYKLQDKDLIQQQINKIICRFPQYKKQLMNHFEKDYMFSYLELPQCVHKLVRTTNRIERINGKIKTTVNHKRVFPNRRSLERILVSGIIEINTKSTRKVNGMQEYLEQYN